MIKTHIIYIPFTGVGKHQYKGDDWFVDRIEIFKNYTLKSLLNQTNKDFQLWLSFRPEEVKNPLMEEIIEFLSGKIRFNLTFNGLIYHDDKNEERNKTLTERIAKSLQVFTGQSDYIYLTRIDSDDMLREDAIELIQAQKLNVKALTFQLGYVYNKNTNELAEWNPLSNPPFHTMIFPREVFFDAQKHIDWYEGFKSHEDIARLPHRVLWQGERRDDRLYCVFTHNPAMHISTTWNHSYRGKLITENKDQILRQFAIIPQELYIRKLLRFFSNFLCLSQKTYRN